MSWNAEYNEVVALLAILTIAVTSLFVLPAEASKDILIASVGGILGYLTKSSGVLK